MYPKTPFRVHVFLHNCHLTTTVRWLFLSIFFTPNYPLLTNIKPTMNESRKSLLFMLSEAVGSRPKGE